MRILTARVDGGEVALADGNPAGEKFRDVARIRGFIEAWCLEHIGQVLPVTNKKDYGMVELWDDRAVQVILSTGERADIHLLGNSLLELIEKLSKQPN